MTQIAGVWRVLLGAALLLGLAASAQPVGATPVVQAGVVWTRTDLNINPNKWSAAAPDASGATRASEFSASGISWTIDSPNNWNWTFEQTFTPPPDQVMAGTPFTVTLIGKAGGAKQNGGVGVGTGYRLQGFTADQVQVDQPQPAGALDIFVGRSGQGILYSSATLTAKLTAPAAGDELALAVVSNGVVIWRAVYHKQPAPAPVPVAVSAPPPPDRGLACTTDLAVIRAQVLAGEPVSPLCPGVEAQDPASNPAPASAGDSGPSPGTELCPASAPDSTPDDAGATVLLAAQVGECSSDMVAAQNALMDALLGQDWRAFMNDLNTRIPPDSTPDVTLMGVQLPPFSRAYYACYLGARSLPPETRMLTCSVQTFAAVTDADNHPLFPRIRATLPVLMVMARDPENDPGLIAFRRLLAILLQQDKANWPAA